jgi:hypothetical protein
METNGTLKISGVTLVRGCPTRPPTRKNTPAFGCSSMKSLITSLLLMLELGLIKPICNFTEQN